VTKQYKRFNLFLLVIFITNILQAIYTPLLKDEAYYWSWAQHLAWGYFDHPPMVAYMIKLSSLLFSGTLGVRFITVLLNILMAFVVWKLIPNKKKTNKNSELIYFTILLAMPFFNLYGFITTPDAPLLFFGALYLLALKKIENNNNLLNTLFFGLAAALLIYSKFFGGIVILLSILFKPRLLKKGTTYLAGITALILLMPYIYWQYNHDFITLNYHLFQRKSIGDFKSKFVFGYLLGTIGVLNPGFIFILFKQLFKKENLFLKKNKFMVRMFVGYIAFFFIYSFRSWIEAHWVAFATVPMVILLYNLSTNNQKALKAIKYISITSILVLFLLRILMTVNLPFKLKFNSQKENYFQSIAKIAKDRKVIFVNSYQKASAYSYYTGINSFSVNDIYYRKNQYDLWNFQDEIKNKKVLIIGSRFSSFKDSLKLKSGDYIWYKKVNKFRLLGKLKASLNPPIKELYNNETGKLKLSIINPYDYDLELNKSNSTYQISLHIESANRKFNRIIPLYIGKNQPIKSHSNTKIEVGYKLNRIPIGEYRVSIVIKDKYLAYRRISDIYKVEQIKH